MKAHDKESHSESARVPSRHHRKIRGKAAQKKRRRWIAVFAGLFVIAVLAGYFHSKPNEEKKNQAEEEKKNVPVKTVTAKEGNVGVYVEGLGTVTPVQTVMVTSRVQGQITDVKYQEGQMVRRGDPLIEIDARPYEAAVGQAEGQLAHDRAALREARIDLSRYEKAYKQNAIPKQQLDDQVQMVLQDKGSVEGDEGSLESAQVNLNYCHITSPINGRMGLRLVDPGNVVQANGTTALAVVTQLQPITVIFSVAEDSLPEIIKQVKGRQSMEVDAYDRTQKTKIATGTFFALDNQIDPTTGTVKIRAVFSNQDEMLFPNQFVNARLLVTTQNNVTLISSAAIQRSSDGAYVYVVKSDQTAEMRTVKPGTVDKDETAVQGLQPGEVVVVSGFDKLQDGAKVAVQASNQAVANAKEHRGNP